MSSRDDIAAHFTSDTLANQLLDAHRDEVTRRNAALLRDRAHQADWDGTPEFRAGLREGAELLTQVAGGQHDPTDFFQREHTYTHSRWQFRCDTITTHPATGEHRALGWLRTFTGQWQEDSLDLDDWASGNWADTTDTTQGARRG